MHRFLGIDTLRAFVQSLAGRLAFHSACGPSDAEVAQVLGTIRRQVGRLLRRRGLEPVEFLEKLAALTPRPEINLVLFHRVLAPHSRWRPEVVAYRRADIGRAPDPSAAAEAGRGRAGSPGYWRWAALMRRAFDLDVLRSPRCAGRMQLIATIEDPAVIQRILAHLGLPGTREGPSPCSMTEAGGEQPTLPGVSV